MFIIGEAVVDDAVSHASFHCDLEKCKGACCCIEGGRGAPLEDDEVLEIEKAYPIVKQYLGERSMRAIEASGLYDGSPGDFATTCIDQRDCVFVYYEHGIARCSFETAFERGEIDWRKPISCHLFPVRIRRFGKDVIRYEEIDECRPGRERGMAQEVPLHDFLREPLVHKYGETWYNKFLDQCKTRKVQ